MNTHPSTILVVDDEPHNLKLMEAMLAPQGYEVVTAPDGETALHHVAENPPDVVLLDVMMPGLDGFEVCRRLKDQPETRFIPVVLVTALHETEDRVRGLESGCDDFLSKPVDATELRARVTSLLKVKALHDQIQQQYDELRRLEELRDNLVHMVVHDMRTPLMGISGYLELAASAARKADIDKLSRYLALMSESAQTLTGMVNDLLDISKLESGEMKLHPVSVELKPLVDECFGMVGEAERKGVRLLYEAPDDLPAVHADPEILRRVLTNLVANAVKFSGENSHVTVVAEPLGAANSPEEKPGVQISVIDEGPGIPAAYHEKIFEKFGTVEARQTGQKVSTGLGLTFCKMAVEAHGGRIWVESEVGKGSAFRFSLACATG